MADTPSTAAPRWMPFVNLALAVIGTIVIVGGVLTAFGGWRSRVDSKLDELDKRVTITENIQRTNLPAFYRMQGDLSYLADRAREQEQRERERDRDRRP